MLLPILAALALSLGRELPSSIATPEAGHAADFPVVASDGRDFVVVWNDVRGVRATKITAEGDVVQPLGVPLPPMAVYHALWNGSEYLLLSTDDHDLYITRMDRNLNILDAQPKKVHEFGTILQVVPNGSRLLIRLTGSGVLLGAEGDRMKTFELPYPSLATGSNGTDFLVVANPNPGYLTVTRVSRDGDMLDAAPRVISTSLPRSYDNVNVASDGNGWLVTWRETDGAGKRLSSYALPLNADGSPRGPAVNIPLPAQTFTSQMVWGGSAYVLMAGADVNIAWRASLDRNGRIIGSPVQTNLLNIPSPALASNGSRVLAITASWFFDLCTLDDMTAQLLDGGVTPHGPPFPVTYSRPSQRRQAMVFDGNEFLAVWSEATGLYMGRMTADGQTTTARGIQIVEKRLPGLVFATAFDGREFVVVWNELTNVYAQRVRRDGTLDGAPVQVTDAKYSDSILDLACDGGGGCLALWQANDHSVNSALLRGGVAARATTLQRPVKDARGDSHVVWDGHEYIVISARAIPPAYPCFSNCGYQLDGQRVSGDGIPIDPSEKVFLGLFDTTGDPAVAWAGEEGLLVWTDRASYCATLDRNLQLTSVGAPFADSNDVYPVVAFDGRNYVIVTTPYGSADARGEYPLHATVVSADGRPSRGFISVLDETALPGFANLIGLGGDRSLVTYLRRDDDGVPRAFSRIITDDATVPPPAASPGRHRSARH